MPLTASGQADGNKPQAFVRIMAVIEGLVLAGVMYLVSSVHHQELSMAELKASSAASQQAMAAVPALTIRVAQAERDIAAIADRTSENTEDIKELRNSKRLQ